MLVLIVNFKLVETEQKPRDPQWSFSVQSSGMAHNTHCSTFVISANYRVQNVHARATSSPRNLLFTYAHACCHNISHFQQTYPDCSEMKLHTSKARDPSVLVISRYKTPALTAPERTRHSLTPERQRFKFYLISLKCCSKFNQLSFERQRNQPTGSVFLSPHYSANNDSVTFTCCTLKGVVFAS